MPDHFVITIGRQLGSGGRAVGQIVAERLGVRMYDKQLLDLAARQSGLSAECFERVDEQPSRGAVASLLGYFRTPYAGSGEPAHNILSNDALFKIQSDVIREISERESALFVGRCADYILRDHPCALHLFLTADRCDRVARIARMEGLGAVAAAARLDRVDEGRESYYNYYTGRRWGEAATYDLSINTSRLGIERTAEWILGYAEAILNPKNQHTL